jgi:3-deoxy-D-manno-octulosonic-acid transferase
MIAQSLPAKILAALWVILASLLAPLLPFYLRRRVAKGKEIAERLAERQGHGAARPPGRLIWCHAASNGETLSLLPLMEALAKQDQALSFLVTTGTVTSARLLEQRLSPELVPRTQHRFLPLDVPRWVARFLDGWRPDLAVIVESELWPNVLAAAGRQGVPLALINARMSARSARGWGWVPGFARALLGRFAVILAQTEADAARFATLAERPVPCWGNLKYAAPPLPADPAELARLTLAWEGRPVWLAASTHPGEDEIILAAHRLLAPDHPGLLTVIVPRHPQRGPDIAALAADLPVARRGAGQEAGQGVAVPWCHMAGRTRWKPRGLAAPSSPARITSISVKSSRGSALPMPWSKPRMDRGRRRHSPEILRASWPIPRQGRPWWGRRGHLPRTRPACRIGLRQACCP